MSRRKLTYSTIDVALADIERLRKSHTEEGQWTLAQACYHCAWPLKLPMVPATTTEMTDEQKPFRAFLDGVNAAGAWPEQQLPSPPSMDPPADADNSNIDDYIAGLRELAACRIPTLENQAFGPLAREAYTRFTLIHAAHHFSHFHPTA